MLPESFAGSFLPQRTHHVLGRALRPFSLWHQFLLQVIESPFLGGDREATVVDLEIAVRICTVDWPRSVEEVVQAGGKATLWQKLRLLRLVRRFDLEHEAQAFGAYVHDHCQYPEFWSKAEGGDEMTSPPVVGSVVTQLLRLGYPEAMAWRMGPGKAHWLTAISARCDGADIRFFGLSNAQVESAHRMRAEYLAAKAKAEAGGDPLTPGGQ